jgi:DNA-binding response OmpR family regulator
MFPTTSELVATGIGATSDGSDGAGLTYHDARRLAKIYSELEEFQSEVIARVERRAASTTAAESGSDPNDDLLQLRAELVGLQERMKDWQERLRHLVGLDYDPARRLLQFDGGSVRLTPHESQLMQPLISQSGRVLAVDELFRGWRGRHRSEAQLRNYVLQLRRKLALLKAPAAIINERGVGYSLRIDFRPDMAPSPAQIVAATR